MGFHHGSLSGIHLTLDTVPDRRLIRGRNDIFARYSLVVFLFRVVQMKKENKENETDTEAPLLTHTGMFWVILVFGQNFGGNIRISAGVILLYFSDEIFLLNIYIFPLTFTYAKMIFQKILRILVETLHIQDSKYENLKTQFHVLFFNFICPYVIVSLKIQAS